MATTSLDLKGSTRLPKLFLTNITRLKVYVSIHKQIKHPPLTTLAAQRCHARPSPTGSDLQPPSAVSPLFEEPSILTGDSTRKL
jgi:hypothetical protein